MNEVYITRLVADAMIILAVCSLLLGVVYWVAAAVEQYRKSKPVRRSLRAVREANRRNA